MINNLYAFCCLFVADVVCTYYSYSFVIISEDVIKCNKTPLHI